MEDLHPLDRAAAHAKRFLEGVGERPAGARAGYDECLAALGGDLPDEPQDPGRVIDDLVAAADPGIVASQGPRFFGFVVGGSPPVATAAEWLTAAWDQVTGFTVLSPAAAAAEEVCRGWLASLLGLPRDVSFGFTTGCQMAHFSALAAARHHVLAQAGWDVEARGLSGAPPIRVVAPQERHATVDRVLRFLGLGTDALVLVPCDDQARVDVRALAREVAAGGGAPTIVIAQAGNVNTGAWDDLGAICDAAHDHGAWVHVDGAFGLWAAAAGHHALVGGVERADSWAVDGHKTLNVPYDCGYVFCAHPEAHAAANTMAAGYLVTTEGGREGIHWSAESSRRARVFATYAVLRALGRQGVADLVTRQCALARRFADRLTAQEGVEVLNDVVLNQVLVRFGDDDARTDAVIEAVQRDGTAWMGGTTFRGRRAMRISVSHWATTQDDVDRSADVVLACAQQA